MIIKSVRLFTKPTHLFNIPIYTFVHFESSSSSIRAWLKNTPQEFNSHVLCNFSIFSQKKFRFILNKSFIKTAYIYIFPTCFDIFYRNSRFTICTYFYYYNYLIICIIILSYHTFD